MNVCSLSRCIDPGVFCLKYGFIIIGRNVTLTSFAFPSFMQVNRIEEEGAIALAQAVQFPECQLRKLDLGCTCEEKKISLASFFFFQLPKLLRW